MAETLATTVTTEATPSAPSTVTVEAPSNGRRTSRIDAILALMMFFCLIAVFGCTWIAAKYQPTEGTWQMLSDTRQFFATVMRDILIGFLTLAYPKR